MSWFLCLEKMQEALGLKTGDRGFPQALHH